MGSLEYDVGFSWASWTVWLHLVGHARACSSSGKLGQIVLVLLRLGNGGDGQSYNMFANI